MAGLQKIRSTRYTPFFPSPAIPQPVIGVYAGSMAGKNSETFIYPIVTWNQLKYYWGDPMTSPPDFAQEPVSVSSIMALAWRCANFTLKGSVTATNAESGDSSTIDLDSSSIVTQQYYGSFSLPTGGPNVAEERIAAAQPQCVFQKSGLGDDMSWSVTITIPLGLPPQLDNSGSKYISGPSGTSFWESGNSMVFISQADAGALCNSGTTLADGGPTDSGVSFTILPIGSGSGITSQKLWDLTEGTTTWSGNVTLTGAPDQFYSWGGKFNTSDGTPI